MKKITTICLMGLLTLTLNSFGFASSDRSDKGYRDSDHRYSDDRDDGHRDGYRSKLYGTVEERPSGYSGTWIINGRAVLVTPQTRIEEEYGSATIGSYVEVKGSSDGQVFRANKLEVKQGSQQGRDDSERRHHGKNEFYGTIQSMPQGGVGTWLIDDREVFVDEQTWIEREHGRVTVGAFVEVKGNYRNDIFHALKIERKRTQ